MGLIQFARPSPIEALVNSWMSGGPSFLWAPTNDRSMRRCRVTGAVGTVVGNRPLSYGGLVEPVANSADGYLNFPTIGGVASAGFIGALLVSVRDPTAVTGACIKIGDVTAGIGFGAGNTTWENSGSKLIILEEGVAWRVSATSSLWVAGLNVMTFGRTSTGVGVWTNHTAGTEYAVGAGWTAPTSNIFINGYTTSRGSNIKVHAAAIFSKALSEATGAYQAERAAIVAPALRFGGLSRRQADELFVPRRTLVPVASAGGGGFQAAWVRNRSQVIGAGVR